MGLNVYVEFRGMADNVLCEEVQNERQMARKRLCMA